MPHRFRQKPSSRRQARPTASWLVLGMSEARLVVHGQRTTHLTPVKSSHHAKRFLPAQRLSVKAYVGGPTECHVIVSDAQRIQLGAVDYSLVRELGHPYLDAFMVAWVEEHDAAWCQRWTDEYGITAVTAWQDDALERFQRRHAHKWVWVVRFALDRTETPRMLAQAGRDSASFVEGPDRRWRYRPGIEDAETDRGYTSVDALALRDAGRALDDEQHEQHVARPALVREARRQAMLAADRAALTTTQRVAYARHAARSKGLDMRSEFRLYDRHVRLDRAVEALRQLELIESRVFPQRRAVMKQYHSMHGPLWIDPNYIRRLGWPDSGWGYKRTVTTTGANTTPYPEPLTEDRIREIVRKEIAELPIKYDVPDSPEG